MTWLFRQVAPVLILVFVTFVVQIRKSVRKKHTLPAYKLRYQPFFTTPSTTQGLDTPTPKEIYVSGQKLNVGQLHVYVLNCTRLIQLSADDPCVYCTVSIGNCCLVISTTDTCLLCLGQGVCLVVLFSPYYWHWYNNLNEPVDPFPFLGGCWIRRPGLRSVYRWPSYTG